MGGLGTHTCVVAVAVSGLAPLSRIEPVVEADVDPTNHEPVGEYRAVVVFAVGYLYACLKACAVDQQRRRVFLLAVLLNEQLVEMGGASCVERRVPRDQHLHGEQMRFMNEPNIKHLNGAERRAFSWCTTPLPCLEILE